ncbi:YjiH family protein [Alkalihalobacillus pseudalcaliphilus]|uniref:YjiH family protein n=1 Tax=Alkalihalobacillus pseudalcaliphilus TaxID=79884 RepID=UPI00064DBC6D|nr:YjiH family protein [Alkalihalobacillus pseudalcaliphilus]KMK78190.1 membrane protein [Alkalihalobacillus pseudalcaliphilus]
MQEPDTQNKDRMRLMWKFILPSLMGVFLFITPIPSEDGVTIPVAYLAGVVQDVLGESLPFIVFSILAISFVLSLLLTLLKNKYQYHEVIRAVFVVSPLSLLLRFVGVVLVGMVLWQVGPEAVWSGDTGGTLIYDLIPVLFSVFLFAGLFLPLLMDYGLLEFVGKSMNKIMRPLFKLPGRSSVDALASWVGDGTVGVLITNQQYENGYYTKREAAVIGTTFSVVSITFSIVILQHMGLGHMFFEFYIALLVSGFAAAIIMPRIPPLSLKTDTFINGEKRLKSEENKKGQRGDSLKVALGKVSQSGGLKDFTISGVKNVLDMWLVVIPVVVVIGTVSLIIAEKTPLFTILGTPFEYILTWMQVPEAQQAAQTMVVGFADMFLPALLGADIQSEMTRFIIATVSVAQLIYMSEIGGLLLGSKIPVRFIDLVLIFIIRTSIALPIVVFFAHIFF